MRIKLAVVFALAILPLTAQAQYPRFKDSVSLNSLASYKKQPSDASGHTMGYLCGRYFAVIERQGVEAIFFLAARNTPFVFHAEQIKVVISERETPAMEVEGVIMDKIYFDFTLVMSRKEYDRSTCLHGREVANNE